MKPSEKYLKAKNLQKLKSAKVCRTSCRYDCASAVWLCLKQSVQLMLDAVVDYYRTVDVPPIQGTLPSRPASRQR